MYRAGDCPVERERCDSRLPPVVFGLIFSRHLNYATYERFSFSGPRADENLILFRSQVAF